MARSAPFGASEPLHIFHDEFFNHPNPMTSHAPIPPPTKLQRKPLQSSNSNAMLDLPSSSSVKPTALKPASRMTGSPLTPLKPSQNRKLNMVPPMMPPTSQPRSTDSLEKKQPLMSRFKTVTQKPAPEAGVHTKPREKTHQPIYPAPPALNFSLEPYCPRPPGKRALMEAAPIKEHRPAKKPRLEDSAALPTPDSFPPIIDDGTKPGHSYAQLIGMAILRSSQRRLTLAQIYKWISDNFSFYNAQDAGWQNSIRHNLSLNKHFIKQERPKDDPGKGNYWAIEPGMEHIFMKDKHSRKMMTTAEDLPTMPSRLEPSQMPLPTIHESLPPSQGPVCQSSLPPLPPPSSQGPPATLAPELSSDATIPVSDTAGPDDIAEKTIESDDVGPYSPLPDAMHSSPPIPKHVDIQPSGTPPSMHGIHGSSVSKSRSHKRKFSSMDDSGYISSLESSAMRPQHYGRLSSEADRPRIKRGRAEEEIARLRASSYDSPSKGRSWNGYAPPSSSPLRQLSNDGGQMLPPLTPAMKLKATPKPPPSVSPGTNLRLHRENVRSMIESPYRRVVSMLPKGETILQLTPGFNVDEVFYGVDRRGDDLAADNGDFDIFQDGPFAPMFALSPVAASNGSPAKRPVKRQRLDRSQSTSAMNEIVNLAPQHNALNAPSFLRVPGHGSTLSSDTPSKVFDGLPSSPSKLFSMQSPSKMPASADAENIAPWISMDDLCSPEFLEDNDFSGIDMLAGFEKIGSHHVQPSRQSKQSQKPGLGRSYSTTF